MLGTTKTQIRTTAQRHKAWIEPILTMVGLPSAKAERRIRHALRFPPRAIVEITSSPTGGELAHSMRMGSCGGRDQFAHQLYYNGWPDFEYPLPSLMTAALANDPSGVFVDIGANTGVYSLLAKALRPERSVHAFEPFPPIVSVLTGNIELNPFAADIKVVRMAASDQAGIAQLYIPTFEHGLIETSASLSSDFKPQHSQVVEVKTIRLDEYCSQWTERVGIMKVDVEGAEDRALKGAAEVLASHRPIVFCEILPSSGTWNRVLETLTGCDYAVAALREDAVDLSSIETQDVDVHNYILYPRGSGDLVRKLAASANVPCAG